MTWKCRFCGEIIESEEDVNIEEQLWGHIQMKHEEEFEMVQDLDTPCMLESCYSRHMAEEA